MRLSEEEETERDIFLLVMACCISDGALRILS